jgi:hypothetical protein
MATQACWTFSGQGRLAREQCVPAAVDPAHDPAVNNMSADNGKRTLRQDLLIASMMLVAGLSITGLALTQLRAAGDPQVAQATQPLQSTPGAETKPSAPPEPATSGARPTEIPPQPARPDAEAQKAGATPALPPAPAEKTAAPIEQR